MAQGGVLDQAGYTVSLTAAAKVLGIARSTAYELAARDELGVRVLRIGRRWVVPTADLRRLVGLESSSGGAA